MFQTMLVPTRFVWRYGGTQVMVCGSFTGWQEMVPMAPSAPEEGELGPATLPGSHAAEGGGTPGMVHSVTINIPPGYHQ